jgi:hypothetical protein
MVLACGNVAGASGYFTSCESQCWGVVFRSGGWCNNVGEGEDDDECGRLRLVAEHFGAVLGWGPFAGKEGRF